MLTYYNMIYNSINTLTDDLIDNLNGQSYQYNIQTIKKLKNNIFQNNTI
jgi:hypothetical protein